MHRALILSALLLVFAQLATTAQAQEPGLKLKRASSLYVQLPGQHTTPMFIEADRVEGQVDRDVQASGNVIVRRYGELISAEEFYYSVTDDWLLATGDVHLVRVGDEITGEQLYLNVADDSGVVDRPTYRLSPRNARGQAATLQMKNKQQMHIEDGTYTTCDVDSEDWIIRADSMDLDRTRDVGVAHNATVIFKGVPLLYSPYLDYSLSGRKSGLLAPSIGTTGRSGLEFSQPFYWNIAPNRDATFTPRFLSKRGTSFGNEARYLDTKYSGELHAEYLGNDQLTHTDRYALAWQHRQDFGNGFSGLVNALKVSDDAYFTDLSDKVAATSQTNLPREVTLNYSGGWWGTMLRVQRFQTLQDPAAPITPPYERVPQITFNADRSGVYGLDLDFSGEWVQFDHPTLINGQRQIFYPSVSVPLQTSFFHITPKIGYHHTSYNFDDPSTPNEVRNVPIYSVDSTVTFERETMMFGRPAIQTLEPRLYYVYIPFRQQNQLPNFDSATADFNFASIFTENQYTGGDRINDANQLTAALSSRLLDPETGVENLRVLLGQRFYFSDQQVTLDEPPREASKSDILAALGGKISPTWSADISVEYDATQDRYQRSSVVLRNQQDFGKVFNLSYRLVRDSLEQVDASTQWPITGRLSGLGSLSYSLRDSRMVESLVGLEYNGGCWALRLVGHRFASSTQETVNAVFLQLELNGISRLGSSPLDLLRQNVGGYAKTNDPSAPERPLPVTP